MYNFYRHGWVVGRLVSLVEKVFGSRPIVFSFPYRESIGPNNNERDYLTFLLVGNGDSPVVESIRARFASDKFVWVPGPMKTPKMTGSRGQARLADAAGLTTGVLNIGPAEIKLAESDTLPTDDWPFLYLREPTIPALSLRGMALVAALSLVILLAFAPVRRALPTGACFSSVRASCCSRPRASCTWPCSSVLPGWSIPSSSSRS